MYEYIAHVCVHTYIYIYIYIYITHTYIHTHACLLTRKAPTATARRSASRAPSAGLCA